VITDTEETTIPKETVIQQINVPKGEKTIETQYTKIVQQAEEVETTHYKIFQEKAMSQQQFTKETTFADTYTPNSDNPKQFER
jgi:hypothetical protein